MIKLLGMSSRDGSTTPVPTVSGSLSSDVLAVPEQPHQDVGPAQAVEAFVIPTCLSRLVAVRGLEGPDFVGGYRQPSRGQCREDHHGRQPLPALLDQLLSHRTPPCFGESGDLQRRHFCCAPPFEGTMAPRLEAL